MGLSKVQSKAGKLKIKRAVRRGRPLTPNVAREPNGRISRRVTHQEPADRLALMVRARKLGVGVEEARDPRLATYIGRLAILGAKKGAGGISGAQYDAAQTFLEVRNNYQRAILSSGATWEECVQRTFGEMEAETTRRNIARYEAMMKSLQQAQSAAPCENLSAALQYIVIEDRELPHVSRASLNQALCPAIKFKAGS